MKGKRLEASKLTPEERNDVLKYATVGCVLIAVGILFGFMGWLNIWETLGLSWIGSGILAFIWGYVGAIEEGRS